MGVIGPVLHAEKLGNAFCFNMLCIVIDFRNYSHLIAFLRMYSRKCRDKNGFTITNKELELFPAAATWLAYGHKMGMRFRRGETTTLADVPLRFAHSKSAGR